MKMAIGFVLAFAIGFVCRSFVIPSPALTLIIRLASISVIIGAIEKALRCAKQLSVRHRYIGLWLVGGQLDRFAFFLVSAPLSPMYGPNSLHAKAPARSRGPTKVTIGERLKAVTLRKSYREGRKFSGSSAHILKDIAAHAATEPQL